jgi:hypothetical protein
MYKWLPCSILQSVDPLIFALRFHSKIHRSILLIKSSKICPSRSFRNTYAHFAWLILRTQTRAKLLLKGYDHGQHPRHGNRRGTSFEVPIIAKLLDADLWANSIAIPGIFPVTTLRPCMMRQRRQSAPAFTEYTKRPMAMKFPSQNRCLFRILVVERYIPTIANETQDPRKLQQSSVKLFKISSQKSAPHLQKGSCMTPTSCQPPLKAGISPTMNSSTKPWPFWQLDMRQPSLL